MKYPINTIRPNHSNLTFVPHRNYEQYEELPEELTYTDVYNLYTVGLFERDGIKYPFHELYDLLEPMELDDSRIKNPLDPKDYFRFTKEARQGNKKKKGLNNH